MFDYKIGRHLCNLRVRYLVSFLIIQFYYGVIRLLIYLYAGSNFLFFKAGMVHGNCQVFLHSYCGAAKLKKQRGKLGVKYNGFEKNGPFID